SEKLFEQRFRLLQIERIEPFTEPAVDRSEKIAALIPLALITPEPRHAHRCAQFPGLCLLLACNRESALKIPFRLRRVRLRRLQGDFAGNTMNFGLVPSFLAHLDRRHRFTNTSLGIGELTEFSIRSRQM